MYFHARAAVKIALILAGFSLCISTTSLFTRNSHAAETGNSDFAQRSGAAVYAQMCARCHGSDGRANTAKGRSVSATDLRSSDWVPDVARDTRIVTRGKESMPAFKAKLKPVEIEAVVSYIRRFK